MGKEMLGVKEETCFLFFLVFATVNSFYNKGQPSIWLSYAFVSGAEFTATLNDLQSTGL